ncbi:MAG: ATP phosphoribosyltransferase regulatory subunit, partial [Cocleimonas sp.]
LGQAIARGGRYDDIGKVFGRARAATGFSADLKVLNQLSSKQFSVTEKIFVPLLSEATEDSTSNNYAGLQTKIAALRAEGEIVIEQLPATTTDASAMGCTKSLCLKDGQWVVQD